ncbi:PAS domain-containing sensor histidine kinase [Clostridium sp. YIM B02505]|uniref:histidine kinase n=1 Tax=Clostridium yunnanense TaxID=2800325 RepID=A0ABS1EP29_9CLOT|nr:PAS domain-containing sensor histidine kinase [Clostridium yunnanense]MBK1811122.1 PAS domain-containing sensor histidine kinase [Clostridium yunnanense]
MLHTTPVDNIKLKDKDNKLLNLDFNCFDYIPTAILVQRDDEIVYANKVLLKIFQCDYQWILGKSVYKLLQVEDDKGINAQVQQCFNIKDGEYKIKKPKGDEIEIELKVNDEKLGDSTFLFLTVRDISIERREYELVRNRGDRYNDILENLPVSIYITIDGNFEKVNKEGLKLLGVEDFEDIKGKSIMTYIHPDDFCHINSRKDILYNKSEAVYFEEQKIIRKDNEILTIESASFPYTVKGKKGVVTTIRDISKRKQLEVDLHESRELYKSLVDILPIGISIHDGNTFSFVSDSYVKILGYDSPDELVGQKLTKIASKEVEEVVYERLNSLLDHNITLPPIEYKFVTKQNTLIDVEIISVRFSYNKKVSIISTVKDITEKKKAEKDRLLLEKTLEYDRLKTEFFTNISHELRTPLNILLSSLQLIELYVGDDTNPKMMDIKKYSNVMKQNCYRLLRLINNLLDITKIDSGYYGLNFRGHNIVKIVEDITQSVAAYMKEKNIQIIFDTDVEEKIIGCDEDKIEKVVLSLLSNAVKFTKPGGVIDVSVKDLGESVKISVKDTGIGIPKDKLGLIFERFIQVDKSLSRISEGAGIGLALAKALIKMHGGTINVTSEYGKYTQFDIVLPLRDIENENVMSNSHQYLDRWIENKDKAEKVNIEFSDIYI